MSPPWEPRAQSGPAGEALLTPRWPNVPFLVPGLQAQSSVAPSTAPRTGAAGPAGVGGVRHLQAGFPAGLGPGSPGLDMPWCPQVSDMPWCPQASPGPRRAGHGLGGLTHSTGLCVSLPGSREHVVRVTQHLGPRNRAHLPTGCSSDHRRGASPPCRLPPVAGMAWVEVYLL